MNGTSFSHTLAIDLMPPSTTTAVSTAITLPVIHGEMPKVSWANVEIELAWVMQPMPNAAMAVGWLLMLGVFGFLFVVMQRALRWKSKRETELLA